MRRRPHATFVLLLACAIPGAGPAADAQARSKPKCKPGSICTDRTETLYAVSAHADDEFAAWALIENRPETYTMFVVATRGEQTRSCLPAPSGGAGDPGLANGTVVEALTGEGGDGSLKLQGPYRYQGPNSPVGEPDKGERHPYGNPWQGKGTPACRLARLASWHWFLDDMGKLDGSLPDMGIAGHPMKDDDYRGRFCPDAGCAEIWANADGARIAFDFGDGNLTPQEVTAGLAALRKHRRAWKLPVTKKEEVLAASYHYEGDRPACGVYPHPDHGAVQAAILEDDQNAGPQRGVTCPTGERYEEHPGPLAPMSPLTLFRANEVDPLSERRIGPYVVNYGWLFDTYWFQGDPSSVFWER